MKFHKDMQVKIRELYAARLEPEAFRLLASAYWALLVVLLVLMCVGSIGYGVFQFMKETTPGEEEITVRPQSNLSRTQLQELLDAFDARDREFESRRVSPASVRDPS